MGDVPVRRGVPARPGVLPPLIVPPPLDAMLRCPLLLLSQLMLPFGLLPQLDVPVAPVTEFCPLEVHCLRRFDLRL